MFQAAENKWIAKISLGVGGDGKPIIKQFSGTSEGGLKGNYVRSKRAGLLG